MEKKDAVFRSEEDLSEVKRNAWSIGAYNIPETPVEYLGSLTAKRDIYHYYRDKNGKYYFESENTLKFDREMREAQERRKKEKRSAYIT